MKKILSSLAIISLAFTSFSITTLAEKPMVSEEVNQFELLKDDPNAVSDDVMPKHIKEIFIKELKANDPNTISPMALIGMEETNNKYAKNIPNAVAMINAKIYDDGFWNSVLYNTYSGFAYTGINSTYKVNEVSSRVSVRATGLSPYVSSNGLGWSIMSGKHYVTPISKETTQNYDDNGFSNLKIQNITTASVIFQNEAFINVQGLGKESWTVDIWFW